MTVEQELQQSEVEEIPARFEFHRPDPVSFEAFIQERKEGRHPREAEQPSYALPVDHDIRRTLALVPFGRRIDDMLERMIQLQIGPHLHNAVRVSPRQFPSLYRVVDKC